MTEFNKPQEKINRLITIKRQVLACIGTAILGLSAFSASAGWITLTNNDANGTSSFAEKRNWNDSAAPHAGNDYGVIDGRVLRSLPTAGNVTFQGHSLTVSNGGTIFYKSPAGQTITVGNSSETGLFLDGGKFLIIEGGKTYTLAGFITLGANNGLIDVWNGTGTIASQIGGSGSLVVLANNSSSPGSGTVVLSGANTYSGATVLDVPTTLRLANAGTLGGGTSTLAISNSASKGFGTVDLNGTSQTIGNLIGGGGRIINNLANTTSTLTVGAGNTGGGLFLGSISNAAGILALKKVGTTTLTLAGTNRYTGGTIIEDGALQMSGITGPLGGAGKLVLLTPDGMPVQHIEGMDPAFSGQLVVKSGWLIGANGAFGTNSITVDPYYTLDPSADGVFYGSTAVLEPDYDVNSAGTLTLVNGGVLALHQNCAFTAVTIEGTPLSPGTHPYTELAAMFPSNFSPNGAGAITVQPYGTLPVLSPEFVTHPVAVSRYAGYSAQFSASVAGEAVTTFQWYKDGNPLADGNNISGATTATLTVVNISNSDVGNYHVVASNAGGSKPSNAAFLTLLTPAEAFENAAVGLKPIAYLRLNEMENPALGNVVAHDYAGGFDGVYGPVVENGATGMAGPRSYEGFSGFSDLNSAARFMGGAQGARIALPALNLNTNTVTLTAWINPGMPQADSGIIFCRGSGTVAGLQFTGNLDPNGWRTLGYTWNNEGGTWTWNSRIAPPPGIWSMVALVITPTNASIYLYNAYGLKAVTRPYNHVNQAFSAPTLIGEDSHNGNRQFDGLIDEVVIYSQSLSQDQLTSLYGAASGITEFGPSIASEPEPLTLYEQQTAQFSVQASGTQPLTFQWQRLVNGIFENMVEDGRISGANTATLTIKNIGLADDTDYQVAIANNMGAVLSMPAHLTVQPVLPAEQITLSVSQNSGQSWDTLGHWSDGLAASLSAVYKPGSTYHILPGAAMRTPNDAPNSAFPGELLEVQGNGVFTTTIPGSGMGAVLIKSSNWGTTSFKRLVMAGGQIMNFINSGGNAVIAGQVEVIANTPVFSADDTSARSIRIDAHLAGNGNIEYRAYPGTAFMPTRVSSLNIAGTSNTYSGTWNVMMGTLVGSAPNALGTNTIVVGVNGALQVNYDLQNTNSDLVLDGRFNLTGNHTFRSVVINGTGLEPGLYEFTQLTNLYAANFPATWLGQPGADSLTNGSGSIRVLSGTAPVITAQPQSVTLFAGQNASLSVSAVGEQPLNYQWKRWNGSAYVNVANSASISGAQSATLSFSPLTIADSGDYVVEIVNTVGAKTSSSATVTVTPVGDPLVITMSALQTNPQDWDTASFWSDNQPASVSAVSNPGSTYRILPGAGMRTPSTASQATFPGEVLHVEGDGVYSPAISTIGAIMLKGANPSTVSFKRLVMEGGEILNFINNSGNGIINGGELSVMANTPITAANASSGGSVRIDSQLTGNGNIEYRGYASSQHQPTWTSSLNITGTSNTFSGTWNVLIGTLVGSAPGALGTNSITVGPMGALQTTYDLLCPHATLTIDGRVHLDRNYHFARVLVGGAELAPGYYSFQTLNHAYPDYFPATWTGQMGVEAYTTGAGGLTVGDVPLDVNIEFGITGSGLELKWAQGILLEATELNGPWTTNTTAVSPLVITPDAPQKFYRIQVR